MSGALHRRSLGALALTLLLSAAGPSEAPIADASMKGDMAQVRALLEGGADVNAAHGDGMTALHWAAQNARPEIAEMLVHAGANLEAVTRLGDVTPLHLAARSGSGAIVKLLVDRGADVSVRTSSGGSTPLHFAAASGDVESATALMAGGADVDVREERRLQTPLMFAAAGGRTMAVIALLDHGADPSLTSRVVDLVARADRDRAAGQRRDQILEELRAEHGPGDEAWSPSPAQVQAAVTAARQTPDAATDHTGGRDMAAASAREEAGPEEAAPEQAPATEVAPATYVGTVGKEGGMTALLYAVREGHTETAFALMERGAAIDQRSEGDGTTPLLSSVINGHFDLALDLVAKGAKPNMVSEAGTAPLFAVLNTHWAPKARYPQQQAYQQQNATYLDVMQALLEVGADPNLRLNRHLWFMEYTFSHLGINTTGATAFWRAAHALDVDAMELLVEYGADPNIPTLKAPARFRRSSPGPDPSGLPPIQIGDPAVWPIHVAAGHGYGTGYAGNSHRHIPDGWLPAMRYLVEVQGADVNARDENGYSPLHNAASRGDLELIEYLVEHGADVSVVSRRGQTTVDMANGPQQRTQPYPEAIALLESLGAKNSHNCVSCD